jgi:hypothetical protein
MKTLLFVATAMMINFAWACPGGNLKILKVHGEPVGEINVTENTISLKSYLDFANVVWDDKVQFDNPYEELPQYVKAVGDQKVFNMKDLKGVVLSEEPDGQLLVIANPNLGTMTTYYWIVRNFSIVRGLSCAQEVEAEVAQ